MNDLFIDLVEAIAWQKYGEATTLFRQFISQAGFPFESNYADGYRVIKIDDFNLLVFRRIYYEETLLELWSLRDGHFIEYRDDMESFIARCFDAEPTKMASIFYEGKFWEAMHRTPPLQE